MRAVVPTIVLAAGFAACFGPTASDPCGTLAPHAEATRDPRGPSVERTLTIAADFEARWSADAERELETRRRAIESELARRSGPTWEGRYFRGDGTGEHVELVLGQSAGFVAGSHGCIPGRGHDRNHGDVRVLGDVLGLGDALELAPAWPNERVGLRGFPTKLLAVRWGERNYLLEESQLVAFCNAINHGWEPRTERHGCFFLHDGDEARAIVGKPRLGERGSKLLLDAPLAARICHVERFEICVDADRQEVITRITLDRGWRDGVVADLEFFVGDARSGSWMTIEDTAEHTARGILDRRGEGFPTPPIGTRATTRP
ncbi:MAG: hypothetical protein L6Q99_12855 [Planctomycetes bacterium]|nr:hypothetical protein [Planctomycetota bacterium]